jgi:predicted enzyme related to lactoylglutathione lyase
MTRFAWHDLMTRDPTTALAFYGSLLGWEGRDADLGQHGAYIRLRTPAGGFAGLVALVDDPLPSHWMPCLQLADVQRAAQRVVALGGKVLWGPFEPGGSRSLVAEDDQGAWFSVIDGPGVPGHPVESHDRNDPFVDHVLLAGDLRRARVFWEGLTGWSVDASGTGFSVGGRPVARLAVGAGRARWRVVIGATDPVATARRALALGATTALEPGSEATGLHFLQDPTGAVFTVGPVELPAPA